MIAAFVAMGCHNSAAPAPPAPTASSPEICRGFNSTLISGLTINPAKGRATYLELREDAPFNSNEQGHILGTAGTLCADAKDKASCQSAYARIRSPEGFSWHTDGSHMAPKKWERYLVANFGDTFELVTREEDLAKFLAPIDNTYDLELVAGCGRMAKTTTGWEIVRTYVDDGSCWGGSAGTMRLDVTNDGRVSVTEDRVQSRQPTCFGGRRTEGLVVKAKSGEQQSLADFFAESAYLESVSIVAFERLVDELGELGAPADLIERARQSREDEIRHADAMANFARRLGASTRSPEIIPTPSRSAFAIALENAVEGCIRETYGALLAHYQANASESAEVRSAMIRIAEDETAHAALSWDIAEWLEPRLSKIEQRQIHDAKMEALEELALTLQANRDPHTMTVAGLPNVSEAEKLLSELVLLLAPRLAKAAA